ncbi:M48 family metalloprotease [Halosimplex pelagicum]|uniref:Peptidase M48 domain-containing protein n=1 Tax=Halosimplex pelagicum TaxID=869886 RepID=A0A7D5TSK0_9EURY|nr:M48 family metalloprotease [Halosimplex pelagicum]QLH80634.1 hypothetical protein HZS54_02850 [Halosimplex pelagicum]
MIALPGPGTSVRTLIPTPLQSAGEAAIGSIVALAAVSLVAALAYFLYGRRFRAAEDTTAALSRVRRAFRFGFPVTYVLALVAMAGVGWIDAADGAVEALLGDGSVVGDALTLAVVLVGPSGAVFAGYFGALPTVRDLRDVDVSAATVAARLARWTAGVVVVVTLVFVAIGTVGDGVTTAPGFVATVFGLLVLSWLGSPWLVRLLQSTRAPTEAERERLARLCEAAGLDVRKVRVLEVADAKQALALVRGLPERRHLFVSDYLLSELDDEHLRGCLALQAGRARVAHLEARATVVVGTVVFAAGPLVGVITVPGVGGGTVALVVFLAGVLALWAGRRLVYRADAYAADRTSRETVESTIRGLADLNDAPMEWGRLTALRRMEPSLNRRIDRLRDRAARE